MANLLGFILGYGIANNHKSNNLDLISDPAVSAPETS